MAALLRSQGLERPGCFNNGLPRRTARDQYVGLDVALKETSISVRQNRKRIWRGKCPSHPEAVAEASTPPMRRSSYSRRVRSPLGFTAVLSPKVSRRCASTHAKAALNTAPNKTDANDADGLALLAEAGFFREVRVKSFAARRLRALLGGRSQLVGISTGLSNHIRGIMKTFGLVVPKGGGRIFDAHVRTLLEEQEALASIVLPLLETWRMVRAQARPPNHGARERPLPADDDGSRSRCPHRALLCKHDRGSRQLQKRAFGRRLYWSYRAELSIG